MMLVDLVRSISRALPWLVEVSARRPHGEMMFGTKIGYAFVAPRRSDPGESIDIENANTRSALQATTLGILGQGRLAQAVARTTSQSFGADVIYHQPATS